MSIWSLLVQDSEPVSAVEVKITINDGAFDKSDLEGARPIHSDCVGAIVTPRGVARGFSKPSGRFSLVDPAGVEAVSKRVRTAKAEQFKLMVDAEEAFNQVFSKDPWPEQAPISGIQVKTIK